MSVKPVSKSKKYKKKRVMPKQKKHPGFKAVAKKIAKEEGISIKRANAIVASSSRNASPAAKKANPRLNKVKGKK